jgi:autophagy-related protein 17
MARHLESLAAHYDQMASALRESEAGEEYAEDDLYGECSVPNLRWSSGSNRNLAMNRDTNELPSIISELEASCNAIEASQ